jgi:hypothetical protein
MLRITLRHHVRPLFFLLVCTMLYMLDKPCLGEVIIQVNCHATVVNTMFWNLNQGSGGSLMCPNVCPTFMELPNDQLI